jgi:hypothetical protein
MLFIFLFIFLLLLTILPLHYALLSLPITTTSKTRLPPILLLIIINVTY